MFILGTLCFFVLGGIFLYLATLRIPDLEDLSERKVLQSTKIYDRTGEILLYDFSQDITRTIVPFDAISDNLKKASLAIEDRNFYEHNGIKITSFFRALLINIFKLEFSQGGSTITQQVVKNTILTNDKTPTRKLKEWILALKLEKVLTKDEILNIYLNEIPYGGRIYGAEEASEGFFGKRAKDLTIAEAAYIAAVAKAPTYYSPYGKHREALESRKNLVLSEMRDLKFITEEEYQGAKAEVIEFKPRTNSTGIKAPHFVFFVIEELANRYGEEALEQGGFKVVSSLDFDIQMKAEEIALKFGETNKKQFNANNNASVVIDPKTGDVLAMVGSRDYWNDEISGNYNVSTGSRQPGSTFKPIVYAEAFNKGYTPETILFDVPTQFSSACPPDQFNSDDGCYSPGNYDDKFRGPMSIRNALAQSINIPAVKTLYLVGVNNALNLARSLGIENLGDAKRFGLSLVLGGGEVSLLDMTSAYSVFANDGVRNPYNAIVRIENEQGEVLEQFTPNPIRVLPEQTARNISSILSDNVARTPGYGPNSLLYVPDRDVAVKTGTTNDYKDAWIIGYSPNIVVGFWVGNSNNTPMEKKVAGFIVAPLWREMMNYVLPKLPPESFVDPVVEFVPKPMLSGDWGSGGGHSILHWVDRDNPRGAPPVSPASDSQYRNWEYGVSRMIGQYSYYPTPAPAYDPNFPMVPGTIDPNLPPVIPTPTEPGQVLIDPADPSQGYTPAN